MPPFFHPLSFLSKNKTIIKPVADGSTANKLRCISRGVIESKKRVRVYERGNPPMIEQATQIGVLAGNTYPKEIIEHFPILFEDAKMPYLFVKDRKALGEVAGTKRSTATVIVRRSPEDKKAEAKKSKDTDKAARPEAMSEEQRAKYTKEYHALFDELVKVANDEYATQVMPWVKGIHPEQMAGTTVGGGRA
jgi:H/ACA ribonucleoprotein complex subunit 2